MKPNNFEFSWELGSPHHSTVGGTNNFSVCAAAQNSEKSLGTTELLRGSTSKRLAEPFSSDVADDATGLNHKQEMCG